MVDHSEITAENKLREAPSDVHLMFESCIGCKWTLHVLGQIRKGINRPGALVRTASGLTTKVLNERLAKLVRFDVLEKVSYPEVPPRVEYRLTKFGEKFVGVLDQIEKLGKEFAEDKGGAA